MYIIVYFYFFLTIFYKMVQTISSSYVNINLKWMQRKLLICIVYIIFINYLLLIQPLIPNDPLRVFEFNIVYCILDFICPLVIVVDKPL